MSSFYKPKKIMLQLKKKFKIVNDIIMKQRNYNKINQTKYYEKLHYL